MTLTDLRKFGKLIKKEPGKWMLYCGSKIYDVIFEYGDYIILGTFKQPAKYRK